MSSAENLIVTITAQHDLKREIKYLRREARPGVAARFQDAIDKVLRRLLVLPDSGSDLAPDIAPVPMRRIRVSSTFHHWSVFYTQASGTVRIERVLHDRRNMPEIIRAAKR